MGVRTRIIGTMKSAFVLGTTVLTTLTANALGLDLPRPLVTDGWGGKIVTITVADSPYTPTDSCTIFADASGGAITIALPTLATGAERVYTVKKTLFSSHLILLILYCAA